MPEGELWERDSWNGETGSRRYSEMYLGNEYEEEPEPAKNSHISYADQFLGEEPALSEAFSQVEGEEWDETLNGDIEAYADQFLGEESAFGEVSPQVEGGEWEETLNGHRRAYADQFLGEEPALSEAFSQVEGEEWDETLNGDREGYPEAESVRSPKPETTDQILKNRIRDPEVVRRIYEIRNSFNPRDLPRLSRRSEKLLNANYRQLSIVESGLLSKKKAIKTVYVTSPFRGSGKTIAAVSMAYALSVYGGNDTLLVDGHFQSPQVHRLFSIRNTLGLSDALTSRADPLDVIIPTVYDHLYVVANGGNPEIQVSYEGEMIRHILRKYSAGFNYIVFDGAAVFASPEPAFVAPYFDGVVVILECEKTKWEVAQMTVEKILNAGGHVAGIILNKRKFYVPRAVYNKI